MLKTCTRGIQVSIPFKREGSFGHADDKNFQLLLDAVSIPFKREGSFGLTLEERIRRTFEIGFNSLQTGRLIRTVDRPVTSVGGDQFLFPFPSNGKAHSDYRPTNGTEDLQCVSIPFKREGSFGRFCVGCQLDTSGCFNSLQTGRLIRTY